MTRHDRMVSALIALLILACAVEVTLGWRACRAAHGHYVRGLFWMECLR